jgi:hypothetical protein
VGRQTGVAVKAGAYIDEAQLINSRGLQNGEREIAINVDAEAGGGRPHRSRRLRQRQRQL